VYAHIQDALTKQIYRHQPTDGEVIASACGPQAMGDELSTWLVLLCCGRFCINGARSQCNSHVAMSQVEEVVTDKYNEQAITQPFNLSSWRFFVFCLRYVFLLSFTVMETAAFP
jgi:hypothetical protein